MAKKSVISFYNGGEPVGDYFETSALFATPIEEYYSDGKLKYKKGEYEEYPDGSVKMEKLPDGTTRFYDYNPVGDNPIKRVRMPDGQDIKYKQINQLLLYDDLVVAHSKSHV